MIIYGFLSYYDGTLRIPNKELMTEFEKAINGENVVFVDLLCIATIDGSFIKFN